MVLINVAEVYIQKRVTVRKKERCFDFSFQQAEPAGIVFFQLIEIGLDHALFVVHDHREIVAAEVPEPVHDQLGNGLLAHGDQRLGQNFCVRVQPRAQPARHHHNGNIDLLAVVQIQAVGKDDVGDDAALVQDRQRVDAMLLQNAAGLAALGHRDAQRMIVGRVVHGLVRCAAAQEKLADVTVGDDGLQMSLRCNEQDALAGLVQLAQRFQYRGGGRNKKFFYFYQGWSPFDVY